MLHTVNIFARHVVKSVVLHNVNNVVLYAAKNVVLHFEKLFAAYWTMYTINDSLLRPVACVMAHIVNNVLRTLNTVFLHTGNHPVLPTATNVVRSVSLIQDNRILFEHNWATIAFTVQGSILF